MTDLPDPESRLSELSRLATLLSDQVLDAQIMRRPVPEIHVRALLEAGLLLEEYQRPLPPLLSQILHEVGAAADQTTPLENKAQDGAVQGGAKGLAWLLRPFQGLR